MYVGKIVKANSIENESSKDQPNEKRTKMKAKPDKKYQNKKSFAFEFKLVIMNVVVVTLIVSYINSLIK